MKKKILTLTLSLALAFSLSACGNDAAVSSPADREPVNSETASEASDESSVEDTSSEESSSGPEETSSPLQDWYDSSDRTLLEDSLNKMFSDSGMSFFLGIEEPGTIIYTYQYDESLTDTMSIDDIQSYFRSSLDAQYQTFVNEIGNFKKVYGMPLTTIRITYLDADGSELYSTDFTEDYVPEEGGGSSDYANLDEWMVGDERELIINAVNTQLASSGMMMDVYADGNVLVMDYTYTEQQDLEGLTQEDIDAVFDEQVAPTFSSMVTSMFDSFESEYGLILDDIRLVFRNADGTELYSCDYSDL